MACSRVFRAYMFLYTLTHYLQCIHEYDVVNVCVSVQTFQFRDRNLFILLFFENIILYVSHPISSDNDLISQKLLFITEFYYPLYVAIGVAYSCLKYGVFITT